MPTLLVYRGGTEEARIELGQQVVRIGRAVGNELVLDKDGKSVSRFHAELRYENGGYVLVDLNSQNGVWVEGERVRRKALKDGMAVVIGPNRLVMEDGSGVTGTMALDTTVVNPASARKVPDAAIATTALPHVAGASVKPSRRPARAEDAAAGARAIPPIVARLLRLPRPVLVGGVAGVIVLVFTTTLFVRRHKTPPVQPPDVSTQPTPAPPPAPVPAPQAPPQAASVAPPIATPTTDPLTTGAPRQVDPAPVLGNAASTNPTPATRAPLPPEKAAKPQVPRGRGESLAAWKARSGNLDTRFAAATATLERGEYAEAQRLLSEIIRDEPQFAAAVPLLEKAREREREAKLQADKDAARLALAEAKQLEGAGNLKPALDRYLRAQGLDAGLEGIAPAIAQLREKMRVKGEDAFTRAKVLDAYPGKAPEALALYESAAQLLPPDHPNLSFAQARIVALKGPIR